MNDCVIVDGLEVMDNVMAQANAVLYANHNQNCGTDEFHVLGKFKKNNPSTFKGRYDPEGAQAWILESEKIFRVMACTDAHEVLYETYMLYEEDNIHRRKKIKFLQLKQWSMTVDDYVAKFKELSRFCPHYNGVEAEGSKCVKFKSGLCNTLKFDTPNL